MSKLTFSNTEHPTGEMLDRVLDYMNSEAYKSEFVGLKTQHTVQESKLFPRFIVAALTKGIDNIQEVVASGDEARMMEVFARIMQLVSHGSLEAGYRLCEEHQRAQRSEDHHE